MANVTALCPQGPRGNWREYFAARVEELVTSRPELDGGPAQPHDPSTAAWIERLRG